MYAKTRVLVRENLRRCNHPSLPAALYRRRAVGLLLRKQLGKLPSIYPLIGGVYGEVGEITLKGKFRLLCWRCKWHIIILFWELRRIKYEFCMSLPLLHRLMWLWYNKPTRYCYLHIVILRRFVLDSTAISEYALDLLF